MQRNIEGRKLFPSRRMGLVVACCCAVVAGACSYVPGAGEEPTVAAATDDGEALVAAADQSGSDGSTVTVDQVRLPDAGYAVVYTESNNAPGERLGASDLLPAGENEAVTIKLEKPVETSGDVFVMLHIENSGDSVLTFPGPDEPLSEDGRIVLIRVPVEVG